MPNEFLNGLQLGMQAQRWAEDSKIKDWGFEQLQKEKAAPEEFLNSLSQPVTETATNKVDLLATQKGGGSGLDEAEIDPNQTYQMQRPINVEESLVKLTQAIAKNPAAAKTLMDVARLTPTIGNYLRERDAAAKNAELTLEAKKQILIERAKAGFGLTKEDRKFTYESIMEDRKSRNRMTEKEAEQAGQANLEEVKAGIKNETDKYELKSDPLSGKQTLFNKTQGDILGMVDPETGKLQWNEESTTLSKYYALAEKKNPGAPKSKKWEFAFNVFKNPKARKEADVELMQDEGGKAKAAQPESGIGGKGQSSKKATPTKEKLAQAVGANTPITSVSSPQTRFLDESFRDVPTGTVGPASMLHSWLNQPGSDATGSMQDGGQDSSDMSAIANSGSTNPLEYLLNLILPGKSALASQIRREIPQQ